MISTTLFVDRNLDTLTLVSFTDPHAEKREHTIPAGSKLAIRFMRLFCKLPLRAYHMDGFVRFTMASDWAHSGVFHNVGGDWIEASEEQARDEQTPTRITPDPIPDRLVTEILFASGNVHLTCRQGGEGRPVYHSFYFGDPQIDTVCKQLEDHCFGYTAAATGVKFEAHDLVTCPFCRKSHSE